MRLIILHGPSRTGSVSDPWIYPENLTALLIILTAPDLQMAEVARKKKTRGGHRASATRVITQANEAMDTTDPVPAVADLMKFKLTLEEKLVTLNCIDEEILERVEEDDLEEEIGQADVFKKNICLVLIKLDSAVGLLSARPQTTEPAAPPHAAKVRLPKITMNKYNGDMTKWTAFWDSFDSSIHQNPDISDVDKFNYLNSLLEGAAADAVSGLKLTAANYTEAVEILKRRFGRKQQIIAAHMDVLLNLEAVSSQFNLKGIRHLHSLIETQVRSLKSLGVTPESYGTLLSSVLLNKLPQELRLIVSRKTADNEWDLDRLSRRRGDRSQGTGSNHKQSKQSQPLD